MESILFLKEIRKKGNPYKDVWLNILMQYESNDCPIKLTVPYGMPPSTYHKIVAYGVEVFAFVCENHSMVKNKMQLIISEKSKNLSSSDLIIDQKKEIKSPPKSHTISSKKTVIVTKNTKPKINKKSLMLFPDTIVLKEEKELTSVKTENNIITEKETELTSVEIENNTITAKETEPNPEKIENNTVPKEEEKKETIPEKPKRTRKPKKPVEVLPIHIEIITYLNECTGKDYQFDTKTTLDLINSKLEQGFTSENLKHVIYVKSTKWLNTKYQDYLTPSTLFGDKFENYLNENIKVPNTKIQQAYDAVNQATELGWTTSN
jgi:uncharacterized phage protein (TIGR02220 family)